jgi:ATP-dependent 26S proteasome regulatory subunit
VLDDIDAIGAARGGASGAAAVLSRLLTTLLNELDGVGGDGSQGAPVLVIATASTDAITERSELQSDRTAIAGRLGLDAALLRVGRLEVHVRIPLPSEADRLAILKASPPSSSLAPGVSLSALARFTDGWSASQTAALLPEAALRATLGSPSRGPSEDELCTSRDAASITAAHLLNTACVALGRSLPCREDELQQ